MRKVAAAIASVEDDPSIAVNIGYATDIINEVGLDSLKMTDFILGLEDDFGISIDFDKVEYETFTRVDRLIDFLIEATGASAPSPVAS
ncbi:phosphopantetheine-binding protein [Lysobacter sp. yr284]|uniref:phosphopantetheine-binding protein n=1 Tax=Lysobacter sp. yr284 TaxID=1761791 RepID=UPI000B89AA76|nr:phosphopantetheine-binding protein [Lysobacter sp. yr284]